MPHTMSRFLLIPLLLLLAGVSANAQDGCDDLTIVSVRYSPFTDTIIIVEVTNAGSELFSYPGFVLINANGDTLAKETVNYFGIAGQSVHHLTVRPGVAGPLDNFEGTLQLHTGFYDALACTWPMDQSLCFNGKCAQLVLAFENMGGALVVGDFHWTLQDELGAEVASGNFTMTPNSQFMSQSLCMAPGTYQYTLEALGEPSGGGPTMSVYAGEGFNQPGFSQSASWEGINTMEVPFFIHCMVESPNAVEAADHGPGVRVYRQGAHIIIAHTSNIHTVELLSLDGRSVGRWSPHATTFSVPSGMTAGVYAVRLGTTGGHQALRVVLP
jgi:hypothetical protein